MKLAAVVVACTLGLAGQASALEPYDECIQASIDINTYLRVMQSCSDAYWLREDVGEADAICAGARALSGDHRDALQRQIDFAKGPDSPNKACPRQNVLPLMGLYLKANSWGLQFLKVRLDGKSTEAPPPLKLIRIVDPE